MVDLASIMTVDPISIMVSMAFFFAIIIIGMKKKENPIFLALANFFMLFTLFVAVGVMNSVFAYVLIFICSGILTKIVSDMFLGNFGESKIMLSYLVFLGSSLFFVNYANFTSTVFSGNIPAITTIACNLGLVIIDGLLNCAYQYLNYFLYIMFFSSSIGIVNVVLIVPFLYFMVKFIADWLRGR